MTRENRQKLFKNILKFTAPGFSIFFVQLQMGAELKVAATTALLVMYGLLADLFNKLGEK